MSGRKAGKPDRDAGQPELPAGEPAAATGTPESTAPAPLPKRTPRAAPWPGSFPAFGTPPGPSTTRRPLTASAAAGLPVAFERTRPAQPESEDTGQPPPPRSRPSTTLPPPTSEGLPEETGRAAGPPSADRGRPGHVVGGTGSGGADADTQVGEADAGLAGSSPIGPAAPVVPAEAGAAPAEQPLQLSLAEVLLPRRWPVEPAGAEQADAQLASFSAADRAGITAGRAPTPAATARSSAERTDDDPPTEVMGPLDVGWWTEQDGAVRAPRRRQRRRMRVLRRAGGAVAPADATERDLGEPPGGTAAASPDAPAETPAIEAAAVARPAVARPAVARPAVARPAVARPAVARPAVARPAVARPAVARPVGADRAAIEGGSTEGASPERGSAEGGSADRSLYIDEHGVVVRGSEGAGGRPSRKPVPSGEPTRPPATVGDRVRTLVRAIGQTLVTLGLVVLLFVVYELWVTDLMNARTQHDLGATLRKQWDRGDDPIVDATQPARPRFPGERISRIPLGRGIANIYIPRFGTDYVFTIVEGTGAAELEEGPGHYVDSALPGQLGNFAVAGHRVGKGSPFLNLDKLRAGDAIVIETKDYWYTYRVLGDRRTGDPGQPGYGGIKGRQIVDPGAVAVVEPVPDQPGAAPRMRLLTLTTCHPKFSARERLIIHARQEGGRLARSRGVLPPALRG
jgi:sortase A